MRKRIFPHCYSTDYSTSQAAPWLSAFEAWHAEKGYCLAALRTHLRVTRRVFETYGPVPLDTHFSDSDLVRLFKSRVQPKQFGGARHAFTMFIKERGQWSADRLRARHSDLVDGYEAYMVEMRGLATSTIGPHVKTVREFLKAHCGASRNLNELTLTDVERFIARKSKKRSRGSLQAIVGSLRLFFRYCYDKKLLAVRLDDVDTPRKYRDERPPRAIPWDLAQAFLKSISRRTRMGCRDHAMFYLMTHYGLRTGEICGLKLDDVDLTRHILRIPQTKTHQTLVLPLSDPACRILKRYIAFGRPRTILPELFLSILAPVRPVYRGSVSETFKRRVKSGGVALADYSPYCLRHGFAMRLLGRGVGIKAIGDLLGHRNLESTSAYLRINTDAMRDVALHVPRGAAGGAI